MPEKMPNEIIKLFLSKRFSSYRGLECELFARFEKIKLSPTKLYCRTFLIKLSKNDFLVGDFFI